MFDSTSEPGRYIIIIPHEEALAQQQAWRERMLDVEN